jgi:hypothetical protein
MTTLRLTAGLMSLMALALASGCGTVQAYPGKRRPRNEVATLKMPVTDLVVVDDVIVADEAVAAVEILAGEHTVEWTFVYPNRHVEPKRITFTAEPGRTYRLGQRFFPAPYAGGPLEMIFDVAIDLAVTPFALLFPPEAPAEPPHGDYFVWVTDAKTEMILAGLPPDAPLDHQPITYLPEEAPETAAAVAPAP